MTTQLVHDASKINPKFEGYKLQPCNEITTVSRANLIEGRIQVDNLSVKDHHRLGFRDLQARVRQNHLFYGYPLDDNRATSFIIDHDYQVHMVVYNKKTKTSEFHYISQLIKPVGPVPSFTEPDIDVPVDPQSPSIIAISHELILASNGVGDIELIGIEEKQERILGISLGSICYTGMGNEGIQPVPCYLLKARQIKRKAILVVYSRSASQHTEFHIATLEIEIPIDQGAERVEDGSFELHLKTLHVQTGPEVPVYCTITHSGHCILGSETRFNQAQHAEKTDESGRMYQWSQEGKDITIWLQLPPDTPQSSISCKFVHDHLSLIVKDTPIAFPFRKLWSTVRADECVWTLEKGMLTLFVTKSDENTRWPQLFDKDDGVLETLSVSELAEINARLAKFTSDEQHSRAAQHPAATDMDEEIDEAGQPVVFSVFDTQGNQVQTFSSGPSRWIGSSFESKSSTSVCLGLDVDGLVFGLSEKEGAIHMNHIATLDAFAFVQASKRDARYILHDPSLYFTCVIESTRNIYIYLHHDDKRTIETQTLVDLTLGDGVDVVGAQLVMKNTIMVLTEAQVIVIELE